LYQGRFKSFPIQDDQHFLTVCRYVESNPRRAGLVDRAEDWRYSSLRAWSGARDDEEPPVPLSGWPVARPRNWVAKVNEPLKEELIEQLRESVNRGRPFGEDEWVARTAKRLGLTHTLRGPGRPRAQATRS
jgi:putative transposase